MSLRNAVLCLLGAISTLGASSAMAHIDFKGDFECKASYEKDCYLFSADLDRRTMWIFFDGTVAENGARCELRSQKLVSELNTAANLAGAGPNSIRITDVRITSGLGARGIPNEFRCSYEVVSLQKDLRFKSNHLNRRFWTNADEQAGVCMTDVREAQSIPGSIGAAKWMTGALLQGNMCNTNYATLGLDRIEKDANGNSVLVKYGKEKPAAPVSSNDESRIGTGG
ncbi:hypothetical protein BH10BDE1_BH10BDE1_01940 [soil metagenome]